MSFCLPSRFIRTRWSFLPERWAKPRRSTAPAGAYGYQTAQGTAQTLEETLCAVLFILETLKARGLAVSNDGEQAKRFIANWESEKYRKSLAGGKA